MLTVRDNELNVGENEVTFQMLPRVGHAQEGLGKSCRQDWEQLPLMALEHSTWRDRTGLPKGWEHLDIAEYSKFKEHLSLDMVRCDNQVKPWLSGQAGLEKPYP